MLHGFIPQALSTNVNVLCELFICIKQKPDFWGFRRVRGLFHILFKLVAQYFLEKKKRKKKKPNTLKGKTLKEKQSSKIVSLSAIYFSL